MGADGNNLIKRMKKTRIDTLLVARELVESREQAKRLLLAGSVLVNGHLQTKPGHRVPTDAEIVVRTPQKYVSRGGMKLEKALRVFGVDVRNRVALDVGASTGGFTDCLLQHGALLVYAVDVGYGQLAWRLRMHPRVQPLEKTNIRHLAPGMLTGAGLHIAAIDVSFISLRSVLPHVVALGPADIIALMKPQFEAGRAHVKKGGIVPEPHVHRETLQNLITFCGESLNAGLQGLTYSPIRRDIGNIEYLLWLRPGVPHGKTQPVAGVVNEAHHYFHHALRGS